MHNPSANRCYRTKPAVESAGRSLARPRGSALGGPSSPNGLLNVRSPQRSCDMCARTTGSGSTRNEIQPFLKRSGGRGLGEATLATCARGPTVAAGTTIADRPPRGSVFSDSGLALTISGSRHAGRSRGCQGAGDWRRTTSGAWRVPRPDRCLPPIRS